MNYEDEIYDELWDYLTALFPSIPVVRGLQNNSPLPHNAIVMTLMAYTQDLDQSQYSFDSEAQEATVQVSKLQMMQLDFYGDGAYDRVMKTSTLWRSRYSTEALKGVAPLYANNPRNLQYVNEQDQYEQRFLLEIALQYNPYYSYSEQSAATLPDIEINPVD